MTLDTLPLEDPQPPKPAPGEVARGRPGSPDATLLAVIEAAQGSANKLKLDPRLGALRLHAVMPAGVVFPWDFGFLPSTRGDDGDPLDVLVLMDEAVAPGTVVSCRLLGVIEADQRDAPEGEDDDEAPARERNDRLVAVATPSHRHGHCRCLSDLPSTLVDQIERFFVFYNAQRGVEFRTLGRGDPEKARRLVDEGAARFGDRRRGAPANG